MTNQFVSRGAVKLQAALKAFKTEVKGKVVLDVGSSTGGFVDCLLQAGAAKVYAVDTSYGELAWKLRQDPRVVVMERTNILHLEHLPAGEKDTWKVGSDSFQVDSGLVDLVTIDAGWTKLELVLPVIKKFLKPSGIIIALLKPQYEAEKAQLDKGVVKSDQLEQVKGAVFQKIKNLGFKIKDSIESPILGGAGNKEFFLLI